MRKVVRHTLVHIFKKIKSFNFQRKKGLRQMHIFFLEMYLQCVWFDLCYGSFDLGHTVFICSLSPEGTCH